MNSPDLLRPMYEAAAKFKALKCWNWLSNGHIFGVQNPDNGEIGYCCVMGQGGEMFGMAIYPGTEGLDEVFALMNGELKEDPLYAQHCLLLSFDARDELYPDEYKQIKALGLSFRGRTAWPTFRLYEPGFAPWPVTSEEQIRFFTLCLEQASALALDTKDDPDYLFKGEGERLLVRVPKPSSNDALIWESQWLEPGAHMDQTQPPVDELRCARIRNYPKRRELIWEAGLFYLPFQVMCEDGRPSYPRLLLIADSSTGMILHSEIEQGNQYIRHGAESLLSLLENTQSRPDKLVFMNEDMAQDWIEMLQAMDVEGYLSQSLPILEEAVHDIIRSFGY
ncbi:hypothetical protein KIH86_28425 [Paenibacillus sp. HN-1]|uniref:DUF7309 domain-containing protein n=1 Tax=Paenibacillus TaxID=44249 RepID=UPI001CA97E84|nr:MULTISPECIES: hypothetical protein [Paenibacillus]MBY9081828.1 hypothetical protein [Paenibacillus sp. CGMCC 1.18879]MBY9088119.1 hypothetical protein [Paenibacillus sinensis]